MGLRGATVVLERIPQVLGICGQHNDRGYLELALLARLGSSGCQQLAMLLHRSWLDIATLRVEGKGLVAQTDFLLVPVADHLIRQNARVDLWRHEVFVGEWSLEPAHGHLLSEVLDVLLLDTSVVCGFGAEDVLLIEVAPDVSDLVLLS